MTIYNYFPQGIYHELKLAAEAFLESSDGCEILAEKNEVKLSKILQWYKVDFGCSDDSVSLALLYLYISCMRHVLANERSSALDSCSDVSDQQRVSSSPGLDTLVQHTGLELWRF